MSMEICDCKKNIEYNDWLFSNQLRNGCCKFHYYDMGILYVSYFSNNKIFDIHWNLNKFIVRKEHKDVFYIDYNQETISEEFLKNVLVKYVDNLIFQ